MSATYRIPFLVCALAALVALATSLLQRDGMRIDIARHDHERTGVSVSARPAKASAAAEGGGTKANASPPVAPEADGPRVPIQYVEDVDPEWDRAEAARQAEAQVEAQAKAAAEAGRVCGNRKRYPEKPLAQLPAGVSERDFARELIERLGRLQDPSNQRDANQARIEAEDQLAAAAAGIPGVLRELIEAARSADAKERHLAFVVLGRLPQEEAMTFLLDDGLGSPDASVRLEALAALKQDRGWNVWGHIRRGGVTEAIPGEIAEPAIVHALVSAVGRERDERVLMALFSSLYLDLHDEGDLRNNQRPDDAEAHPAGMHFGPEVAAALRDAFDRSESPEVRERILHTLDHSSLPGVAQLMARTVQAGKTVSEREAAIMALGTARDDGVDHWGPILGALADPDPQIRYQAVSALGHAGRDDQILDTLMRLRQSETPQNSNEALRSALTNMISSHNRLGGPAQPQMARALQLMEDRLAALPGPMPSYNMLHAVLKQVEAREHLLTPDEKAACGRLRTKLDDHFREFPHMTEGSRR